MDMMAFFSFFFTLSFSTFVFTGPGQELAKKTFNTVYIFIVTSHQAMPVHKHLFYESVKGRGQTNCRAGA